MWITIASEIARIDFDINHEAISAIEQIFSSSRRGEHVVFSNRETLRTLQTIGLSAPTLAHVKFIETRVPELTELEKQQRFRIIIDLSNAPSKAVMGSSKVWSIPLLHFSNVAMVPSCVLAENTRDAIAYLQSATHAHKLRGPNGLRISLTTDSGGGADIPKKLKTLIDEEREFILTVTDTDKTHPEATECASTKKCSNLTNEAKWACDHIALNCFEIENILPSNLLLDSIHNSNSAPDLAHPASFIHEKIASKGDIYRWLDLKLGTKLFRKFEKNCNTQERSYWQEEIQKCGIIAFKSDHDCAAEEDCSQSNERACKCLISPGLGDDTLDRYNSYCMTISLQKQIERAKTSTNISDWLNVGECVACWGIAFDKQRS